MSCHCVARGGEPQECSMGCPDENTVPCRKDCTIVKPKNRAFHRPDKGPIFEST